MHLRYELDAARHFTGWLPATRVVKYPAIDQLIPHGPPMRLIDEVLAYDAAAEAIRCGAVPRPGGVFVRDGKLPAITALEYMAQAVAAYVTLERLVRQGSDLEQARPRVGYIVRARNLSLAVRHFEVGVPLSIRASMTWHDGATADFDCQVEIDERSAASVQLLVFEPPGSS